MPGAGGYSRTPTKFNVGGNPGQLPNDRGERVAWSVRSIAAVTGVSSRVTVHSRYQPANHFNTSLLSPTIGTWRIPYWPTSQSSIEIVSRIPGVSNAPSSDPKFPRSRCVEAEIKRGGVGTGHRGYTAYSSFTGLTKTVARITRDEITSAINYCGHSVHPQLRVFLAWVRR